MHRSKKVNTKAKKSRRGAVPQPCRGWRGSTWGVGVTGCALRGDEGTPNVRTFGPSVAATGLWNWRWRAPTFTGFPSTNCWSFEVLLVNARHQFRAARPHAGRQWIQLLHSCGLLRADRFIVGIRALHRHLSNLVRESSRFVQWAEVAGSLMNVQIHRAAI